MHGRSVGTIYFGGGTPTALSISQLDELLAAIRRAFPVNADAEITIEAHPATVSASDLLALASMGFTRISFGAESMDDRDFVAIGRPGLVQQTARAVEAARAAAFTNVNLDLMYGLPGQTVTAWERTLRDAVALSPSHLSCYALTIEEGTGLAKQIQQGHVSPPDDSLQIEMDRLADVVLTEVGFTRYEISNYTKPGHACRHNLLYWTGGEYVGFGPSAESYVAGFRFGNVADLSRYERTLAQHRLPTVHREAVSVDERHRDALIFGLRLTDGVSLNEVGWYHLSGPREAVQRLMARQLLEIEEDRIRLTRLGRQYADTVAVELF